MSENKDNKKTESENSFVSVIILSVIILGGFIWLSYEMKNDLQVQILAAQNIEQRMVDITNNIYYTLIAAVAIILFIYVLFAYKCYLLSKHKNELLDKKLKKAENTQAQISNAIENLNHKHIAMKEAINQIELIKVETEKIYQRIEDKERSIDEKERKIEHFRKNVFENARLTEYKNKITDLTHKSEQGEDVFHYFDKLEIEIEEDEDIITPHKKNALLMTCLLFLGKASFEKKEIYQAINYFSKYTKLDDDNAEIHNLFGISFMEIGNAEYAANEFSKAIELNEDLSDAHYNRGIAYIALHKYDEAIDDFNAVLNNNPNFAEAYFNRGNVYACKGDYEKAIDDMDKVKSIDTDYFQAYINSAKIYAESGEKNKIMQELDKAIQIDPLSDEAFFLRGVFNLENAEIDNAIIDFKETIKLAPKHLEAYNNLGIISAEKKEYNQAIYYFNNSIRLNPTDATIYYNRGLAYELNKEYENALKDYYKVLDMEIGTDQFQEVKAAINELENKGYKLAVDIEA